MERRIDGLNDPHILRRHHDANAWLQFDHIPRLARNRLATKRMMTTRTSVTTIFESVLCRNCPTTGSDSTVFLTAVLTVVIGVSAPGRLVRPSVSPIAPNQIFACSTACPGNCMISPRSEV